MINAAMSKGKAKIVKGVSTDTTPSPVGTKTTGAPTFRSRMTGKSKS